MCAIGWVLWRHSNDAAVSEAVRREAAATSETSPRLRKRRTNCLAGALGSLVQHRRQVGISNTFHSCITLLEQTPLPRCHP